MDSAIARLTGALLALSGCVYEWNGDTPTFPLTGNPPALSSFDQLNHSVAGRPALMTAADGATWVVFCEFWKGGSGNSGRGCGKEHLVRLADPPAEELITADSFAMHGQELYQLKSDMMTMKQTVTLHHPGLSDDVSFQFTDGRSLIVANDGGEGDVFVFWLMDKTTTHMDVFRRDQKFQLRVPLPSDLDPTKDPDASSFDFELSDDGNTLVTRTKDGTMTAWSTLDGSTISLGNRPVDFLIDDPRNAVLTLGDDGLRSVALDGMSERVLTPLKIDLNTFTIDDDLAYYADASGLWKVPLDGSSPAALVQAGAARYWNQGPNGQITWSKDPRNEYAGNAGDGWLGDWRFMERGRQMAWSSDGAHIYFLEHAATVGTYGDLTSVGVPGGAPRTLAINAHRWGELPDHRIVTVENAVFGGTWNRLVVIDEAANTKHWVVPSAADFLLVNNGSEMIVDVVSGASGYDILRVPSP
jgi:hypothetical protein